MLSLELGPIFWVRIFDGESRGAGWVRSQCKYGWCTPILYFFHPYVQNRFFKLMLVSEFLFFVYNKGLFDHFYYFFLGKVRKTPLLIPLDVILCGVC